MKADQLVSELSFKAVRSSGSGGQHVNKVASKVELQFVVEVSEGLTTEEKMTLSQSLSSKLTKDGRIILQSGATRSQHKNKEIVIQRFLELIEEGLIEQEERKPTKVPKSAKKKRLKNKRKHTEKKANRKRPEID